MSDILTQTIGDNIIQIGTDRIAKGSVDYQVGPGGHITIFNISDRRQRVPAYLPTEFVDDNGDPLFADLDAFDAWFSDTFFFNVGGTTIDPEVMEYKGKWNAATNTPTLANTDGVNATGNLYVVSVAGTHDFGAGLITFAAKDAVVYDGLIWDNIGRVYSTPTLQQVTTAGATTTDPIGIGGAADVTAILTLTSTTKGFLPPRMTTAQKLAIGSPGTATIGMVVFDTTLGRLCEFTAVGWLTITTSADIPSFSSYPTFITGTGATNANSANILATTPGANKVFTVRVNYQGKNTAGNVYSGVIFCAGRTSGINTVVLTGQGVIAAPINGFAGGASVIFAASGNNLNVTVSSGAPDAAVTWQITGDIIIN